MFRPLGVWLGAYCLASGTTAEQQRSPLLADPAICASPADRFKHFSVLYIICCLLQKPLRAPRKNLLNEIPRELIAALVIVG